MKLLLPILLLFCLSASAAQTITATNTTLAEVQAAINKGADGDTVLIPAGDSVWQSPAIVTNALLIFGAGTNSTIIRDGNTNKIGASSDLKCTWRFETKAGFLYRFSGIQLANAGIVRTNNGGSPTEYTSGVIRLKGQSKMVRIDHMLFTQEQNDGLFVNDGVCGVMDTFIVAFTNGNQHAAFVEHGSFDGIPSPGSTGFGDQAWITDPDYGGTNKWYFENGSKPSATVSNPSFIDSQRGGRWCIRYMTFGFGNHIVTHGAEVVGNRVRGTSSIEFYMNTITNGDPNAVGLVNLRSAGGVIFSNTASSTGLAKSFLFLSSYRMAQPFFWGGWNGRTAWDQNPSTSPVPGGTGTHNGASNVQYLEDTNAAWTINQWIGYSIHNTNAINAADPIGYRYSMVNSNSATRAYYEDATQYPFMTFTNGNAYQFWGVGIISTNAYGLDICGMDLCTNLNTDITPKYLGFRSGGVWQWGNTWNGTNVSASYGFRKDPAFYENFHYYHAQKPGYTPLVYPHPLRTLTESPPGVPFSPTPSDLATGIDPTSVLLMWSATNALTYRIYLDTGNPPTTLLASGWPSTSYSVLPLAASTTYFWKIASDNDIGSATNAPWQFTTAGSVPGAPTGLSLNRRRTLSPP